MRFKGFVEFSSFENSLFELYKKEFKNTKKLIKKIISLITKPYGVHGEIRTHGLKIRNFALYPAELRGQLNLAGKAYPAIN